MLSAVATSITFEQVMLLLLVIGMQLISVTTLIHGINMAYRCVNPNAGNLLKTPDERKAEQDEARWNAAQDRRERYNAARAERRRAEREERSSRELVSSILDREEARRRDDD